jgi:hypothetical protein
MRLFRNRTEAAPDLTSWAFWRWFDIRQGSLIYLTRLTLFRCPWFQIMLHWINISDQDPGIHDHPWSFCSFVLRGFYREVTARPIWWGNVEDNGFNIWLYDVQYRTIRWFNYKNTRDAHNINAVSGKGVLSLLITGPRQKSWGFYMVDTDRDQINGNVPAHFIPWKEYLKR